MFYQSSNPAGSDLSLVWGGMEDSLRGALQALYCRHYNDVTSLSCYLERQLPLREPFYQLKRVPHFQVRDDLHHCDAPAYSPILRLESATPEDVAQRGRAGCRRVLVEGDMGTGKTFLCYTLLQLWAQPRAKPLISLSKSPRLDDISTFKVTIYLDCVRLAVGDYLAKCTPGRTRHLHVLACAVLEMVAPNDGRLFLDSVYDWLAANQADVCVIFDNVDASDAWRQLIEDSLQQGQGSSQGQDYGHLQGQGQEKGPGQGQGLGKVIVCITPGRVSKRNIDSLFYCYGLHPDYSAKLVVSRLKKVSEDLADRASLPKALDSSQELLRNPLTQSLLSTFLKRMNAKHQPQTQFDFIEELVSSAMIGDSYPVGGGGLGVSVVGGGGRRQSPVVSPTSLMSICETVAFECLETNTNYFCKFKFPTHFWTKHLCDCRILHEVHDVTKQGRPVVSFTSRCIRDYLASKRVCRYLLSDRDSDHFVDGLILKRQFHSVVKFCIRQFVKLGRLDMVQLLLQRLLAAEPKRFVRAERHTEAFSRGRLSELKEVLAWLRETDFDKDLLKMVAGQFPTILEVSYNECPSETLRDFVSVADRAGSDLAIQGAVIYMDGMFLNAALGLELARALRRVTALTTLVVCLRCVVDTGFAVNFLCELFEGNQHINSLTLEGPFNSAENLTPALHRRVKQVFSNVTPVALRTLCLEHINYHHRVGYLLSCWPNFFHKLELRKSNLDNSVSSLADKLAGCRHLTTLVIEHCHVLSTALEAALRQLCFLGQTLSLKTLGLSLLSSARHFARSDARRPGFKPALSLACCRVLGQFLSASPTLTDLSLSHDGIDDEKLSVLAEAASRSCGLTLLNLTGNVIGDASCNDVMNVLVKARKLCTVYLHENSFSEEGRRTLIEGSMDRQDLKFSL